MAFDDQPAKTTTTTTTTQVKVRTDDKAGTATGIVVLLVVVIWLIMGFSAFIMSLICFGRSGSTAEKVVGLLISFFIGPFYWIYFLVVKSYCSKVTAASTSAPARG